MAKLEGEAISQAHKHFAPAINGEVWGLLEKQPRSAEDDARLIHAAHASCYHWLHAGTPLHQQRGEWLTARAYSVVGHGAAALYHARRCMALTEQHAELMKDFDKAYACEGLARAHAIAGEHEAARRAHAQAAELGGAIAGVEDKKIFAGDLASEPWNDALAC